jgi:hypothetical protein
MRESVWPIGDMTVDEPCVGSQEFHKIRQNGLVPADFQQTYKLAHRHFLISSYSQSRNVGRVTVSSCRTSTGSVQPASRNAIARS